MKQNVFEFNLTKKKYLKYLKSQEIFGDPFKNKIEQLTKFYLPLSKMINDKYKKNKKTLIVGLAGGQGSGKSTISQIIKIILERGFNLDVLTFSIDDFYKTLKERVKMSKKINKLFLTRGVPGTHDTKILFTCLKKLKQKTFSQILIPKFDKSLDDRCNKKKWIKVSKKPDIVIFEGWCVGASPEKKIGLSKSLNLLERLEDKNQIWRKKVNYELKNKYRKIFNLIDVLIYLKVPNFKYVFKWRLLQEKKLKKTSRGKKTMNFNQVKRFIMFYERITRNMLKTLGSKSKVVINIDESHRLKSMKIK